MSARDGVSAGEAGVLSLQAVTAQLMGEALIRGGTNHKVREMEMRRGQTTQVRGRFMGEAGFRLMISA